MDDDTDNNTDEDNSSELEHSDIDLILDSLIEKARDRFYIFVKLMATEILPEAFIDGRHIELICDELQDVMDSVQDPNREPRRLQLFMPPGSMKSKLASNLFPAWCLGKNPNWCFLAIGNSFEFSVDNLGRPTKDLIDSDQYKAIFPNTQLKKDVQAAGRWDTTRKGRFVAAGVGQHIAGRRGHITICDDVQSEQTEESSRSKINRWYQKGLRTRLLPSGAEIIINTRWHLEDLSGYMEKIDAKTKRPWDIISLPAILDQEGREILRRHTDPFDKYKVGTSFWPEFWPTKILLEKKETMTPNEWNALYMQNPTSEEGTIIKRRDFKIWDEESPPPCSQIIVSMDTAYSAKETADYSAYSVWGVFRYETKDFEGNIIAQKGMILLSAGKGRWDFAELCSKCQEIDVDYSPSFFIIEDRASGQSLIQELRKRGLPIVPFMPEKDKVFRLHACTPFFQQGRVWVPQEFHTDGGIPVPTGRLRTWAEELVEEVISFPFAGHDDLTDTVSQAVLWLRDTYNIDNDGYPTDPDDPDDYYLRNRNKGTTYWSSLMGS
jgi:predicted phage terminase large subunit-like protein